jgi:hypothetical protein
MNMSDKPKLTQSERVRLEQARSLIKAGRYQEAVETLETIDHPTAHEWLRKLREKLNAGTPSSKHKSSAKPKNDMPIYQPDFLQSLPMCPKCGREIGAALVDCTHHHTKQCPYRVEKQENGTIWIFVLGMIWLAGTVVPLVIELLNQRLTSEDQDVFFIFFIASVLPLALTVYGALVFLQSRKLSLSSRYGEWVHTQTLFGKKTEIRYPLMRVQVPHSHLDSDLPMSVLMWCFSNSEELRKKGRVFSGGWDGPIVYLTLIGLMFRGVIQLYVRPSLKLIGNTEAKREQFDFYFAAVPDVYTPRGTLENNLLAILPADHPSNVHMDLKTLIQNTARHARCDIHKLVDRTVKKDVKALGLNERLGGAGIARKGIKFLFGDSAEAWESVKEVAGEFVPKRPAALTPEELNNQLRALSDDYYTFEASQYDLLDVLYRRIDDIIETDRPDGSAN